jgi:hypothetical protein
MSDLRKQFENKFKDDSRVYYEECEHYTDEYVEWLEQSHQALLSKIEGSPVFYVAKRDSKVIMSLDGIMEATLNDLFPKMDREDKPKRVVLMEV